MSPPELPRDAPVVDLVHPVEINLPVIIRDDANAPVFHRANGGLRQRLHLHEPLRGEQRLDDRLAALAGSDAQRVVFDLFQQTLARAGPAPPPRAPRSGRGPGRSRRQRSCALLVNHHHARQVVALGNVEVVRIVRGRHLHGAGAELRVHELVGDDGNHAPEQRQNDLAAHAACGNARPRDSPPPPYRPASFPAAWSPRSSGPDRPQRDSGCTTGGPGVLRG